MLLTDILKKSSEKFKDHEYLTMKMGYRTKSFTYYQAYIFAQKVALYLDSLGLNKGDKIIILAQNSPYWALLFWGALLRGIIVIPVNIQSTIDQVNKIIEQTKALYIFKNKFLGKNLNNNLKIIDIDLLEELIINFEVKNFISIYIDENDMAEILYTSGTTGDPKGVILIHKNIVSNILETRKIIDLKDGQDRVLSVLPLTHIFEQTIGLFLASYCGAHIIYAQSYNVILDLLQKYKITKILLVPEFLKVLMSKIKSNKILNLLLTIFYKLNLKNSFLSKIVFYPVHKKFGGCLDTIASGGAFLDPVIEKEWNCLGFTILQGYGLTETSPVVSCNNYKEKKMGSVGKVIENIELKIEKDGEVLVKGPTVFSGYYLNDQKTKDSFTQDNFFKTGDIGYLDKDGFLFLSGRKKYVIIGPGGQNVFPEDIEEILNNISGVKDSCVVGFEKESGLVEVHAVLLLDNKDLNCENLIEQANNKLASYQKIMGYTVWPLDDFVRSATRKVKKEEVLKYLYSKDKNNFIKEFSTGKLENILSGISGISNKKISVNSKIIQDLNLDSLMLVELVLRIEQDFGITIDQAFIKLNTTIKELYDYIDKIKKEGKKKSYKIRKWTRSWWAGLLRVPMQFITLLIARIFFRLKIEGKENLDQLKFPVIFMPNHVSYLDPLVVLLALPAKIRRKLIFAAATDVLYKNYKYMSWLVELGFNSFPLPREQEDNIIYGLKAMGDFLDQGYSVVFFPEGEISQTAKLLELKRGTALVATQMDCQVVPINMIGVEKILPYCKFIPRSIGIVRVKIGKPFIFGKKDYEFLPESPEIVTKKIENFFKS